MNDGKKELCFFSFIRDEGFVPVQTYFSSLFKSFELLYFNFLARSWNTGKKLMFILRPMMAEKILLKMRKRLKAPFCPFFEIFSFFLPFFFFSPSFIRRLWVHPSFLFPSFWNFFFLHFRRKIERILNFEGKQTIINNLRKEPHRFHFFFLFWLLQQSANQSTKLHLSIERCVSFLSNRFSKLLLNEIFEKEFCKKLKKVSVSCGCGFEKIWTCEKR